MERLVAGELFDETVELRTVTANLVYLLTVIVHVHSAHVNVASGVLYVARQHLESSRLASTVRPQQAETLVGFKRQVQPSDGFLVTVLLPDVAMKQETMGLLKIKKYVDCDAKRELVHCHGRVQTINEYFSV